MAKTKMTDLEKFENLLDEKFASGGTRSERNKFSRMYKDLLKKCEQAESARDHWYSELMKEQKKKQDAAQDPMSSANWLFENHWIAYEQFKLVDAVFNPPTKEEDEQES